MNVQLMNGILAAAMSVALAACGGGEAAPESSTTVDEHRLEAQVEAAKVRVFSDPAKELAGIDDLVDYLLPGMNGPGVECVHERLDYGTVIVADPAEGADVAAAVVSGCLDRASLGRLVSAYAYGFGTDAAEALPEGYPCVADAFGSLDDAAAGEAVRAVFAVRLDLDTPVGSPGVARDQIADRTACNGGGGGSGGGSGSAAGDLAVGDCVIVSGAGTAAEVAETTCLGTMGTHQVTAFESSSATCPSGTTATVSRSGTGTVACLGPIPADASVSDPAFPVGSCVSVTGTGLAARPTPLPCSDPGATDVVVTVLSVSAGRCPAPSTRSAPVPSGFGTVCLKPKSG